MAAGPYGTPVLDSFATLDPAWTKLAGAATLAVSGGAFSPVSGDYADAYRTDIGPFDSSALRVEAFGQIDVMPGPDYYPAVHVQMSTSNHYYYTVYVRDATRIRIGKRSAGGSIDLLTITHSLSAGDWIAVVTHPAGLIEAFTSTDGITWTKRGEASDSEMRPTTARIALSAGVGDAVREFGGGQVTVAYPNVIDSFQSVGNATSQTDTHPALENSQSAALVAIETELGINPSGAYATVAERLAVPAAPVVPPPLQQGQTWAAIGALTPITLPGIFVPKLAAQVVTLKGVRAKIGSGTSVAAQVRRNGTNLGTAITVTPAAATTAFSQVLSADDVLDVVLSSLTGSPADLSLTVYLEHQP